MLHSITRAALRLDLWLQTRLGRPYNALLGVGLAVEIVRRLMEAPHRLQSVNRLVGDALVVAMELALLIHQVGALSHHIKARRGGFKPGLRDRSSAEGPNGKAAGGEDT